MASLYEQYRGVGTASPPRKVQLQVGETKSSMLREQRVRLNVYLNAEGVGVTVIGGPRGHGTIVVLPVEVDTLEEVMPLIQERLKLDERMMYAAYRNWSANTVCTAP